MVARPTPRARPGPHRGHPGCANRAGWPSFLRVPPLTSYIHPGVLRQPLQPGITLQPGGPQAAITWLQPGGPQGAITWLQPGDQQPAIPLAITWLQPEGPQPAIVLSRWPGPFPGLCGTEWYFVKLLLVETLLSSFSRRTCETFVSVCIFNVQVYMSPTTSASCIILLVVRLALPPARILRRPG